MNKPAFVRRAAAALAVAGAFVAPPALAQTEIVAQPNPDADMLASEIRLLATDPRDLRALLSAAELSGRLGDTAAALAFYARAEDIDPANARIPAGRASVLVKLERPGEALHLFAEAERRGVSMRSYAADRGLAYDLLGAPQLAQKDYKAALGWQRDDEIVRRYALSLGITGKVDEAMALLDPLLRQSDRAAWRARAFILAMNGDVPGAERIAASMMPSNMGPALTPFFRRLEALSPADRAYAVHFGELRPSQTRIEDAQFAPELPEYVPELPPARVAAAPTPAPAPAPSARDRSRGKETGSRRERGDTGTTPAPAPAPAPVQLAQVERPALPPPPLYRPVLEPASDPLPEPARAAPGPAIANSPGTSRRVPGGIITVAPPSRGEPAPPGPAPRGAEDPVLASIVASIEIPEAERALIKEAEARAAARAAALASVGGDTAKPKAEPPKPKTPTKPDPAKLEPARVWVQIAGGADERALPLTWRTLSAKSPQAFKGKTGWWVPYKATNRLLAGPFKSAGEAQAFVNLVKKDGVLGFVFTSDPGQKITRLAGK